MHSEEVGAELNQKGIAVRAGYHCSPFAHQSMGTIETGTVRVSFSAFNMLKDVEYFLKNL